MAVAPRLTLAEAEEFVKILYYGPPKTGKTTASAGLARLGPVVHVDAESGLKASPLRQMGIPVENIELHREISVDALDALFWEVKARLEDGGEKAPIGVLWDSTSESHKKLLEATANASYEKQKGIGNPKGRERFDTWLDDYGTNTAEMRYLARRFRDLQCHVGFVALERRDQDESTGKVAYGPDLTPKLASDILGFVDIICHTEVIAIEGLDEPEYWGTFRPLANYAGGDRLHVLPPKLINPSFDRVIGYVTGELSKDTDPDMNAARELRAARKRKAEGNE